MKTRLLITAAALCLAPSFAFAQETQQRDSWAQDDIVVTGHRPSFTEGNAATATRTPTPIEEIPQSIQTLTRTLIEEQELQTLSDALDNVSGVTPSSTMQTVLQAPLIRGFAASYYFDGMPTYQLPASVADPATLINVERVEVAKGPTSTLYGGGSGAPLSGLINIVSRDPSDSFGGSLAVRGGSFNTIGADGDINIPLGDTVAFRLAGMTEQADSYIDHIDSERYAIFPTLAWDISPDTRLVVRGRYNHMEQIEYAGLPTDLLQSSTPIDPYVFAGASDAPPTEVENKQIGVFLSHRFSERLEANFAVSRYEGSFNEWSASPYLGCVGTSCFFSTAYLPSDTEQTFATASLLARLGEGNVTHQVLFGIDYDQTDYAGAMYFDIGWGILDYASPNPTAPFGPTPAFLFDQVDDMTTSAVFIQDQIGIGERLDITVGLRATQLSLHSTSGGFTLSDMDEERLTPRIGATYEVIDGLSLFAGYAEGFRGVVGLNLPNAVPEESQSYEGGLKFASPVPGLTGTFSIYQITRQNVPLSPDGINYYQTGEQRSRGAELDLVYEPNPALSVLFNYTYTDAEVTEDVDPVTLGQRLKAVPEHSARLAARYRFQSEALHGLELGAGVTAVSNRRLTLPNSLSPGTPTVDGLTLVDAQAAYDFGPATLSLSIVNLFDEEAFEPYAYWAGYYAPTQPRSAFVTLRTEF